MPADQAFVTLATTDAYCMGALVVGLCLRHHGTSRKIVVMVSPNVSREARLPLEGVFDELLLVDVLDSGDRTHLSWLGRPELGVTFTKLHCWTLTQYSKCVFLDADTLVLCNVDELFEREELSAAPDPGWPDCFNSGVFVFRPSLQTHGLLLQHAGRHGSFDGGDQGLLNSFFSDWAVKDIDKHLPFLYNLSANAVYTYLPAFHQYGHQARIVHFLGAAKPWHFRYNPQSSEEPPGDSSRNLEHYVNLWWAEYYSRTTPLVTEMDTCSDSRLTQHSQRQLAVGSHSEQSNIEALSKEDQTLASLRHLILHTRSPSSSEQPKEMHSQPADTSRDAGTASGMTDLQDPPPGQGGADGGSKAADGSPAPPGETAETTAAETEQENLEHRWMWEQGNADYLGKDAFDNIKKKLDRFLE